MTMMQNHPQPSITLSFACLLWLLLLLFDRIEAFSGSTTIQSNASWKKVPNIAAYGNVKHVCHPAAFIIKVPSVSLPLSSSSPSTPDSSENLDDDESIDNLNVNSFQSELAKRQQQQLEDTIEFDGYMLRDVIFGKWGACWDVEFQKFDTLGRRKLYLNVLPFQLGRRPFRHATEYDYLCHLQAVVEILVKYNQLDQILYQIQETNKKPRPGTSPLVAVPLRLELTPEQVDRIMGYLE